MEYILVEHDGHLPQELLRLIRETPGVRLKGQRPLELYNHGPQEFLPLLLGALSRHGMGSTRVYLRRGPVASLTVAEA